MGSGRELPGGIKSKSHGLRQSGGQEALGGLTHMGSGILNSRPPGLWQYGGREPLGGLKVHATWAPAIWRPRIARWPQVYATWDPTAWQVDAEYGVQWYSLTEEGFVELSRHTTRAEAGRASHGAERSGPRQRPRAGAGGGGAECTPRRACKWPSGGACPSGFE